MRTLFYLVISAAIVGLAVWAYRENYATQQALAETHRLHRDIQNAHARLAMLRAEWAYLNRPDRLRSLVDLNFERLGLMPMRPEHLSTLNHVPYPRREDDFLSDATLLNAELGGEQRP